ncbi:MAG TPA: bifunctional methylenetetrahydrofolate dehydrogenase/methenyltetrahydrofolate cyclohydrolase FolD [Polyangiales bacterium]|nr:bifunctional methylenetetrahydrofolate dehydrogenase/methenyltetrahydrofolate cyclohydrolase FolD [Polyangiales bacterium]
MTAQIIDGKAIATRVQAETQQRAAEFETRFGRKVGLEVVLVGDDQASHVYVRNKERTSQALGMHSLAHRLPADSSQAKVVELVRQLNADPNVDAILVQLPLPKHIDASAVIDEIDPSKDVDGLTAVSAGLLALGRPMLQPCTPVGCIRLLDEVGCDPSGKHALVIGRSNLVGKPVAQMLLTRNATVTMAHSRSRDLAALVAQADIVVAAAGRRDLVRGEWIKPGAVVLDVGTNRNDAGKLCGDVEFAVAKERASFITPVPGGVGPMTIAMLLGNAVRAAFARAGAGS